MQFGICYGFDSGRASHCGLSWVNLLQVPSHGRDAAHPRTETNSPLLVVRTSKSLKFQLLHEISLGHRIAPISSLPQWGTFYMCGIVAIFSPHTPIAPGVLEKATK